MKILSVADSSTRIAIIGIVGVKVQDINMTLVELDKIKGEAAFQIFDSAKVAGWRHLYYSAVNALNAVKTGTAISNKIEIEALLYASAQDQISKAIRMMGVTPVTENVALLVLAEDPESTASEMVRYLGNEDEDVLELNEGKFNDLMKTYGVTGKALMTIDKDKYEALESLVIEKCALMPINR